MNWCLPMGDDKDRLKEMAPRVLSLLAAVSYVASQLAAVPHAHAAGGGHLHHAARPHVHLAAPHDRHDHVHSHSAAQQDDSTLIGGEQDHDGDAAYLQPVVASSPNVWQFQADDLVGQSPAPWLPVVLAVEPFAGNSFAWCEPWPDLTGGHCALFLTLQTLRI
jgi:hypothetical protein